MTDMECVAGIVTIPDYVRPEGKYYEYGRELATLEFNAAVVGLLEAGATEVVIADAHGPGSVKPSLLHPGARVLTGRPWTYDYGWNRPFDVAVMIGQHAMSNTDGGHLSHTGSADREEMTMNGVVVGEIGLNMLAAGHFGTPYIMLSGDDAACAEFHPLCPNGVTVSVIEGIKRGSAAGLTGEENRRHNVPAIHCAPEKARKLIRKGTKKALGRASKTRFEPYTMAPPYELVRLTRPDEHGQRRRAVVTGRTVLEALRATVVYEDVTA